MEVIIKLESIGDFEELTKAIKDKQGLLTAVTESIKSDTSKEGVDLLLKCTKSYDNLQNVLNQLNQALK